MKFLVDNKLLIKEIDYGNIDTLVVRLSDLNDVGKRFVGTGADERWMDSFDRPGSKKNFSDVTYLENALKKMIGSTN